jgi:2-methylcitrate dehydratase PrpD
VSWLARCERLPADVEAKARLLLLDTLGCLIAGLRHADVRQFAQALTAAFPGDVAWPGSDIKLAPAGAAALGAAAACWDEACEGHAGAHGRPGLPVVPTLLALASAQDVRLSDLLLCLVSGYEVGCRAGEAWRIPEGLHVDGSWHSLGVAAAAARLIDGPKAMQAAIETAACQIPASLYLPITAGSVVRNTYSAHAALLGLVCAGAARAGFGVPDGALEDARRYVLRTAQPAGTTPAGEWTILSGYLKPYAGVRHTHYGVEAALRLRARPGLSPTDIGQIKLTTYEEAVRYCGNRAPQTAIQAQFSLSYAVAAALVLGDLGPDAYGDALSDPQIAQLEQRVSIDIDRNRTRRGARLDIVCGNTTLSETVDSVTGDPERPMTRDEAVEKFLRYVSPSLGEPMTKALAIFIVEGDAAEPIAPHLSGR